MACTKTITNQKGYVLITSCLSLLLIFTLLLSSTWVYWFLREKQTTQKLCYKHVLEAQKILVNTQENLLNLNPEALTLITKKKALKLLMKAPLLKVKIAAKIAHKFVVRQQRQLAIRQKALIKSGNGRALQRSYQLAKELRRKLKKTANFWQKQSATVNLQIIWPSAQVAPSFKEIAPPYKIVTNYKKRQTLRVEWTLGWGKLVPKWWQHFMSIGSVWHGACYSHPHQKGGKWFANIGRGKF